MNDPVHLPASGPESDSQARTRLLQLLESRTWAGAPALPDEDALCILLDCRPDSLRRALRELVLQGMLWRDEAGLYWLALQDPPVAGNLQQDTPSARQHRILTLLAPWAPAQLRKNWRGIAVSTVIALAAAFISATYGGPLFLYALVFGLAFHFLSQDEHCRPGIDFCSKTLLRTGVALLGARITFSEIGSLGVAPVVIVVTGVLLTILSGCLLAKWFQRPVTEGVLSGGAVAICGASAALAISAVLPETKENEKYTLLTVVGVTTLSTIAMVLYPLLVTWLQMDHTHAGIFIGGSIHDVAQVVGAGYLISPHAGDVATFVKLTRVACLVPVVFALALIFKTRRGQTELDVPPLIPVFLIGFVWLLIVNSLGYIPPVAADVMNTVARSCLVVAIAALGIKTSFQALASLGWTPVFMLVAETVWLALFVLVATAFAM